MLSIFLYNSSRFPLIFTQLSLASHYPTFLPPSLPSPLPPFLPPSHVNPILLSVSIYPILPPLSLAFSALSIKNSFLPLSLPPSGAPSCAHSLPPPLYILHPLSFFSYLLYIFYLKLMPFLPQVYCFFQYYSTM